VRCLLAVRHTLAAMLAWVMLTGMAMAVEEPPYQTLMAEAPFELRRYPGFVVAETQLDGDFDSASRQGFRRIAGYIFGGNTGGEGESRKIAMTAPVTVQPDREGWRLHFVMPSQETLETLPKPESAEVSLRQVAAHEVAVVRFSGFTTQAAITVQTQRLRQWMQQKGLQAAEGEPQIARYDDPFTLPWRRRNEILIQLQPR
jgi:hypothetical protein